MEFFFRRQKKKYVLRPLLLLVLRERSYLAYWRAVDLCVCACVREREGGMEGERERGREGGREGGRERERERESEREREREKDTHTHTRDNHGAFLILLGLENDVAGPQLSLFSTECSHLSHGRIVDFLQARRREVRAVCELPEKKSQKSVP